MNVVENCVLCDVSKKNIVYKLPSLHERKIFVYAILCNLGSNSSV